MLACNCLNVTIEVHSNDFQEVNFEYLDLSEEDLQDCFFRQDIEQVVKLININKAHSALIETRNVGDWIVHYCINCGVHSHAVHRDRGAASVLINSKLLTDRAIEQLKKSDMFSKLFCIVVNPNELDEDDTIPFPYASQNSNPFVRGVKEIASDGLKKETLAVENRILKYTEEQYNELYILKEKTFKEEYALIRTILKHTKDNLNADSTNASMVNPKQASSEEPIAAGNSKLKMKIKRQLSGQRRTGLVNNSITNDMQFQFDDVETENASQMGESDNDENKDDNKTGRRTSTECNNNTIVARSLPMNIPTFMSKKSRVNEIEDVLTSEDNLDIAASIKALAKSVHSDTIFGDLPRPRFSTQI